VKKTLSRRREELAAVPAESGDAAAKKSRKEEHDAIVAAEGALASAEEAARKRLAESEKEVEKAQKAYDDAYDALDFDVRLKAKGQARQKKADDAS
jgi:hypothetical protein